MTGGRDAAQQRNVASVRSRRTTFTRPGCLPDVGEAQWPSLGQGHPPRERQYGADRGVGVERARRFQPSLRLRRRSAVMQSYETPILICYDGSPAAVRAIETAAALLGPRRAVVLDVASSMAAAESFAAPYSAMAGAAVEETSAAEAARIADEGTET